MSIVKVRNHDGSADGEIRNVLKLPGRIEAVKNLVVMRQGLKCAACVGPVRGPVDSIGTRLGNLIENRAACTSKLSRKVGGLDTDFLNRIGIGNGECGSGDGDIVVLNAVNQEVIAARPLAVHRISKGAILVNRTSCR